MFKYYKCMKQPHLSSSGNDESVRLKAKEFYISTVL